MAGYGNGKPVKQKWVSLQTKDYAEAKRRKAAVVDQWAGNFDDMRRRQELTSTDIAVAVYDHYTAKVAEGDKERASLTPQEAVAKNKTLPTIRVKPSGGKSWFCSLRHSFIDRLKGRNLRGRDWYDRWP